MNSARNLHCITHNGMGFVGMNQDGLQWQQAQGFARRQEEMMHIEHRYMEMPMRKRSLVVYPVFVLALGMFLTIPCPSFAGGPCGCYCGIYLPAPCSDDACKRACGWKGPAGGGTPSYPAYDAEAERQRQIEAERQRLEAEQRRQQEIQEQERKHEADAKLRQEKFEQDKQNVLNSMKGITEGELGLKDIGAGGLGVKDLGNTDAAPLGLKEIGKPTGDASVVDLSDKKKPYAMDLDTVRGVNIGGIRVQRGVADPTRLREELLSNFTGIVHQRTEMPNKQVQEIMRSFRTSEPPNPVKNITNLTPGDVILVGLTPMKGRLTDEDKEHLKDVMISKSINFLDRWGSNNWTSPASHAAIFLGVRNGKRWYLNNTSGHGPVIMEESAFLKEYGGRRMDVATLVGQPLSQHEGQELWKGAHELRNTTSYGIWADDKMVCSEASRWLLMRAGRRVPETQSEDAKVFGIDTRLNKKDVVKFSPSDFYEEQQYFIVHQLGMGQKGQKP